MKKRVLPLVLALAFVLPFSARGMEATVQNPGLFYEETMELCRSGRGYCNERCFDSGEYTLLINDYQGIGHDNEAGYMRVIYKAGSQMEEGTILTLPFPKRYDYTSACSEPDTLELSEDRKTLSYSYYLENTLTFEKEVYREPGVYLYTVDLPSGEVVETVEPLTYENSLHTFTNAQGFTAEKVLEGDQGAAVLRWSPYYSNLRDYELYLIRKTGTPVVQRLLLPSTAAADGRYPTGRAPDEMFLSEDGSVLTYVYSFEEALFNAEGEVLHDSGTYTYTVDTATGELAVEHIPLPSSPADPVFSDVPDGSWFAPAVEICAREGIMVGTSADTFSPDGILTDVECLTLGWRLYDQARGGDGSVPKAPENWGAITLKSDNGLVDVSGYLGEDRWRRFQCYDRDEDANYDHLSLHLGMSWEFGETYAPCGSRQEPTGATLIFEGVEHRGQIYLDRRGVASGRPPDCSLVFLAEDEELNQALLDSMAFAVTPGQWWRDLSWAIQQESGGSGRWDYDRFPIHASGAESYRAGFAQVLAAVTDLPKRYDVPQIPEFARNEDKEYAYRLYEAGILGGVDEYGTFQEYKSLTRAEAATMVTRVLDESLRLTQPPRPMPQEGVDYTLTYLMEGKGDGWQEHSYPLYPVMEMDEEGWPHSLGMLTLDGCLVPWPEGWEGEFQYFSSQGETMSITLRDVTGSDRQDMKGIMDRNGNWLVEPGRYLWASPLAQGGFYGPGPWDESLETYAWYDILDEDGHPIDRVERFEELEELLGAGEDTWENWGGLTLPGSWYHDCLYYSWPDGTPATNWLDSAGRIGPDGKGFVEKDGKIYRIAFTAQNEEK